MHPTPPAPRIAIVVDWLQDYAGAERVLEQLLLTFRRPRCLPWRILCRGVARGFAGAGAHHLLSSACWRGGCFASICPLMPLAVEQLDLSGFDIVISSSHAVAKGC